MKKLFLGFAALMLILVVGLVFGDDFQKVDVQEIGVPPGVMIDTGYNATLSGTPFYTVTEDDESLYNSSLDTCDEIGGAGDRQQGWYSVVASEDSLTVREVLFEQVNLKEGDNVLAVYYNSEIKSFEAMPNKIIKSQGGGDLPLLNLNKVLKKGEVVVVNSNRSVDFCKDYSEAVDHSVMSVGSWNLISKPDFEKVGYRSIWSVDFSGESLQQYYREGDSGFDTNSLSEAELYWIYGGNIGSGNTDGGDTDGGDTDGGDTDGGDTDGGDTDGGDTDGGDTDGGEIGDGSGLNTSWLDSFKDRFGVGGVEVDYIDTSGVTIGGNFGDVDYGDYLAGQPVMSVEEMFGISGRGTAVVGKVLNGEVKPDVDVTLQCGSFTGVFRAISVDGPGEATTAKKGEEAAVMFDEEVKEQVNCEGFFPLKLKDNKIEYTENIVLLAPKGLERNYNNDVISIENSGMRIRDLNGDGQANRDDLYDVYFNENAQGEYREIEIVVDDGINNHWVGCSQVRVTVKGLKYADGVEVPEGEFDVEILDNGKCGTTESEGFVGKEINQDFDEIAGTVEKVYYDEVGRGFWAIAENGQIYQNFSEGDGLWRLLPGMTPLSRAVCAAPADGGSSNCVVNLVKNPDKFYVMPGQEGGREYSLIAWEGKDNRFYTYDYAGTDVINGNVDMIEKFGDDLKATVEGKFKNSQGEYEDVVYVAYNCTNTVNNSVGRGSDSFTVASCRVQRMTSFGSKIGINGNDFSMSGDRYFASEVGDLWSINSYTGWIYEYDFGQGRFDQVTSSGSENLSRLSSIFFNDGKVYGINSAKNVYGWNSLDTIWEKIRSNNEGDILTEAVYYGNGLVRAKDGGNQSWLFEIGCGSYRPGPAPGEPGSFDTCRLDEVGIGYAIDVGGVPVSSIKHDGEKLVALEESSEKVIYAIEKENNVRKLKNKHGIYSSNSPYADAKILQLIDAGDRVFVLLESGGERYLHNPGL
jgi:hypothetical protein